MPLHSYTRGMANKIKFADPNRDISDQFTDSLQRVADDPRATILVGPGFIEAMVSALLEARCKNKSRINENGREFTHSVKLIVLNEMGVIPDVLHERLHHLRKLRNDAAHQPLFVTDDAKITEMAKDVSHQGHFKLYKSPLFSFMTQCLHELWQLDYDFFEALFAPRGREHRLKIIEANARTNAARSKAVRSTR